MVRQSHTLKYRFPWHFQRPTGSTHSYYNMTDYTPYAMLYIPMTLEIINLYFLFLHILYDVLYFQCEICMYKYITHCPPERWCHFTFHQRCVSVETPETPCENTHVWWKERKPYLLQVITWVNREKLAKKIIIHLTNIYRIYSPIRHTKNEKMTLATDCVPGATASSFLI